MADQRPDWATYFMGIALAVRERASCRGRRYGAILVVDNRPIATGYNGTAAGTVNCLDGGCRRCAGRDTLPRGAAYDLCVCCHAEQNALLACARFGIRTEGAALYTTGRPCFSCSKELLQARVGEIYYLDDWLPNPDLAGEYERLQAYFGRLERVEVPDPRRGWAAGEPRKEVGGV